MRAVQPLRLPSRSSFSKSAKKELPKSEVKKSKGLFNRKSSEKALDLGGVPVRFPNVKPKPILMYKPELPLKFNETTSDGVEAFCFWQQEPAGFLKIPANNWYKIIERWLRVARIVSAFSFWKELIFLN